MPSAEPRASGFRRCRRPRDPRRAPSVVEPQVDAFIANDLELSPERRLLIVTGPNMGGKSTYMRQAAVIALLACCGIVRARDARALGPLDAIHTRIGAADDLAGGRSTFMVEMTEAAAILHRATPQSLVLIDEIGRGTSTFDGLSLAWAIAHQLAEKNRCLALFATHYFELTALPAEIDGCANLHFDAVEHADGIVFLHAAADGPANRSYGLQVAKLAGVPADADPPAPRATLRGSTSSAPLARHRPISSRRRCRAPDRRADNPLTRSRRGCREACRTRSGCDDAARRARGALRIAQIAGSLTLRAASPPVTTVGRSIGRDGQLRGHLADGVAFDEPLKLRAQSRRRGDRADRHL